MFLIKMSLNDETIIETKTPYHRGENLPFANELSGELMQSICNRQISGTDHIEISIHHPHDSIMFIKATTSQLSIFCHVADAFGNPLGVRYAYEYNGHDMITKAINLTPLFASQLVWENGLPENQLIDKITMDEPRTGLYFDAYVCVKDEDPNKNPIVREGDMLFFRFDSFVNATAIIRITKSGQQISSLSIDRFRALLTADSLVHVPGGYNALLLRQITLLEELTRLDHTRPCIYDDNNALLAVYGMFDKVKKDAQCYDLTYDLHGIYQSVIKTTQKQIAEFAENIRTLLTR